MRGHARVTSGALAGSAYVWGSYWLMMAAPASPWNAVALLGPMLVLITALAWRSVQRTTAGLAAAVLVGLIINAKTGQAIPPHALYVGQHAVIHLLLAALFGLTLRPGTQALISRVALRVHGHLTPAMARYSRNVTWAWTLYFVLMALLSMFIFAWATFEVWAVFANGLTPLAAVLMFGAEYLLRYRLHPEFERATMLQAIQAFGQQHAGAAPAEPAPTRRSPRVAKPL